jgi:hypothetical protein
MNRAAALLKIIAHEAHAAQQFFKNELQSDITVRKWRITRQGMKRDRDGVLFEGRRPRDLINSPWTSV